MAYVRQVANAVKPGGRVLVSTFGPEGPTQCNGRPERASTSSPPGSVLNCSVSSFFICLAARTRRLRGDFNDASGYTGNFPFPVVRQNLTTSLSNEIPNGFLLWGTYWLPWKLQLNPHIELRNGFPYQPVNVLQQYLTASTGPQYRFPRYFSLDLLVSKDFQITKKHAIRISDP